MGWYLCKMAPLPHDTPAWLALLLEQPESSREAWLAQQELPDAAKAELASLLKHMALLEPGFLTQPAAALSVNADATPPAARLGPWQLDGLLGEGGMGVVWAAHRADGAYELSVAIKLMRLHSVGLKARFERERRALARLQHPHIARLLDAGQTPDGQPYLVMARVHGQSLREAVVGATLTQKLNWLVQLCDAVASAHAQLLVHRDIKPSNVLVDAQGQVQLLDFGIAKLLNDPGDSLSTGSAASNAATQTLLLTPLFASPEQLRGESVSTASDVYSLGALMYWMLTGRSPAGHSGDAPMAMVDKVLNTEPMLPSQVVGDYMAAKPLRGDLDNIAMAALRKQASERYASASAMGADVRAYLSALPVSVRKPTLRYWLGKWVRRNPSSAAGALASVLAVSVGIAATLWQARQAELARAQAAANLSQAQDFAHDVVLRFGDALTTHPQGQAIQISLLRTTLPKLAALRKDNPQDTEMMLLEASVWSRLSEALGNTAIANPADAAQAVEAARASTALVQRAQPALTTLRLQRRAAMTAGAAQVVLAASMRDSGQAQAAANVLLAHAQLLTGLSPDPLGQLAAPPDDMTHEERVNWWGHVGLTNMVLGGIYFASGRHNLGQGETALAHNATARQAYLLALNVPVHSAVVPGQVPMAQRIQAQLAMVLGFERSYQDRLGQLQAALDASSSAQSMVRELLRHQPTDLLLRDTLWVETTSAGLLAGRLNQPRLAVLHTQAALDTVRPLIAEQGPQTKWAKQSVVTELAHAYALAANDQWRHATQALSAAQQRSDSTPHPSVAMHLSRARVWQLLMNQPKSRWSQALDELDPRLAQLGTQAPLQASARWLNAQTWAIRHAVATQDGAAQAAKSKALALWSEPTGTPLPLDQVRWRDALLAGRLGSNPKEWPSWPY